MPKQDPTRQRLLKAAHEMAKDLYQASVMDIAMMREFDAFCLSTIHELSAAKIKKIRLNAGISQAVFAKIINVSVAAIKQWERGERKPSGAALKLLNLVEEKGLEGVL